MVSPNSSIDVIIEIRGPLPPTGSRMLFKGLSTSEPLLEFEDGTTFVGEFQHVVGSLMVFSEEKEVPPGKHTDEPVTGHTGILEESGIRKGEPRLTTLECIQDRILVFKRKI